MKIVYTPLHGTGGTLVPEAMRRWGFQAVSLCPSQAKPDGTFPTVVSPNPGRRRPCTTPSSTARSLQAELVLATDPDADRVGIAVRHGGEYRLLTGNQVASLLVEYVIGSRAGRGTLPPRRRGQEHRDDGAHRRHRRALRRAADNVLTGFKYIGEKIRQWEESGEAQYMVGGEESYGYLVGTHSRDKDAVVACCFIAEIAADSLAHGQTLVDRLDAVYCRYAFSRSRFSP